jgi:hypothetical protein
MSNDIIASIKNSLATVQGGVDEDTLAIAGGTSGNRRISIRGGVFRKVVGGKEVASVDERYMNLIFVKAAHHPSRTYYTGAYKEGEKTSPTCWSSDSNAPDPEVKTPQAKSCRDCQWSVKGSGQSGSGKACRMHWRTAVVLPNDPNGDVMQLVVPETSCFGEAEQGKWRFKPYAKYLADNKVSLGHVITRMQFDKDATHPKLMFSPVAPVPQEDLEICKAQGKTKFAENAVKLTVYQNDESSTETESADVAPAEVPEPVLREGKKTVEATTEEMPDIIKKWSKKGK